jgi:hypothetical protein
MATLLDPHILVHTLWELSKHSEVGDYLWL